MGAFVHELSADARNRALRTFLQGLAIDVVVGVALAVSTYFAAANNWGDVEWAILGFSVGKSVVQSGASFVMRRWLDASSFPTPLPPSPQPEPSDPQDGRTLVEWLVVVALILAVLALLLYLFDINIDLRD